MTTPEYIFTCDTQGVRVDSWLAHMTGEARERIKEANSKGMLTVNDKKVKASYKVKEGDVICLTLPPLPLSEAIPEQIPIEVVYMDEHLLVVNKEAGMVVHPAPGHDRGTLVNALLGMGVFATEAGDLRPGIVHRIDKDTSGLLVVSRTPEAREGLLAQFKAHSIKREYRAIVYGLPSPMSGTWDTLYGRNPKNRFKYSSTVKKGKRAVTHFAIIKVFGNIASLARVTLSTGRTHQVRVHFTDNGHPLLGDPLYKNKGHDHKVVALGNVLGRQALHAAILGFDHPVTGEYIEFEAALPTDMQNVLDALEVLN